MYGADRRPSRAKPGEPRSSERSTAPECSFTGLTTLQTTTGAASHELAEAATDPLPWALLSGCDAVYFTGSDPATLRLARVGRRLVVAARRREVLQEAAVAPDVIVGSVSDPRENAGIDTPLIIEPSKLAGQDATLNAKT